MKRFHTKVGKTLNLDEARKWLRTQPTYSLHKPIRKRFDTRKYMTAGLNELWQMDLMEQIPYARINKGYKYILTCIDVFSRYARAIPLKSKQGIDVAQAIKQMLKSSRTPRYIQTDLGREFYNKHVKQLLDSKKIKLYTVNSQFKAALCERFNRTLREKLTRYATHQGNKVWYKILPSFIEQYNNSKHVGIFNMRPNEITHENEHALWEKKQAVTINKQSSSNRSSIIPLLNYVRISRISVTPFNKRNYDQNWSEEVFRVIAMDTHMKPIMYVLQDLSQQVIEGKFYRQELQDIGPHPPQVYRIEKILHTKGKGEHKQYYVKWYGYDHSHNSWISNIQHHV